MNKQTLTWDTKPFGSLSLDALYSIMQLRQDVFVLEQACVYRDLDHKDQQSFHLMAWHDDTLAAYARLIPKGISYADAASIGRVVVGPDFRGCGVGEALVRHSVDQLFKQFGKQAIKIGAQEHLHAFYGRLGFVQTSAPYMDAGILHIEMEYQP